MKKTQIFIVVFALVSFAFHTQLHATGINEKGVFDDLKSESKVIEFNNLTLSNVPKKVENHSSIEASELRIEPLSTIEENIARNLNSHWAWRENTLEMIDSYSPFLFRTKKSAAQDEVKVLLQVNAKGKLSGFEIVGEADKGLRERIGYVLRQLPDCKPVPGYSRYTSETFELIIKK